MLLVYPHQALTYLKLVTHSINVLLSAIVSYKIIVTKSPKYQQKATNNMLSQDFLKKVEISRSNQNWQMSVPLC